MTVYKKIRRRLEERMATLSNAMSEIDHTLREPDNPDVEERAVENEGHEVLEGLGNAALEEIAQIKAAIKRMELGTYGQCTGCGDDIEALRLEAMPYAANCIDCAARKEHT